MNDFIQSLNANVKEKEKEKTSSIHSRKKSEKSEEDLSTTYKKLCKLQCLVKEELVKKIQCKHNNLIYSRNK